MVMPVQQWIRAKLRRLVPIVATLVVLGGGVVAASIATATPAAASVGTNDYPTAWQNATDCSGTYGEYSWCIDGNDISPLGFGYRNCTDYAAYELNEQMGGDTGNNKKFSYSIDGFTNGDASGWQAAIINKFGASASNGTPAVGSVAWYAAAANNSYFGHVAIVTGVTYNSNGSVNSITVADYNYYGTGSYYSYSISSGASNWPDAFLHVADVSSGGSSTSTNIIKVQKAIASDGTQQVYYATTSDVYEAWWNSTSNGVQRDHLINIAQNNIVDISKITQPDGTQSLYTAVPDGIWETYWNAGSNGAQSDKIISGLTGVTKVIATSEIDSGTYTHVLYVLTKNGPYQFWWQDGGNGIHSIQLSQINNPVAFAADQTSSGTDQVYTATAGGVWETWWQPGGSITTDLIISITQNNITAVDKLIAPDGTQELYTATTTGVWQSEWGGSVGGLTNTYVVNNFSGAVAVKKRLDSSGTNQLYAANGSEVEQYWWNSTGNGSTALINISQNNITSIDEDTYDGTEQLYTGAGPIVWETWWDSSGIHTDQLATANP
jgi:hypothetical protein